MKGYLLLAQATLKYSETVSSFRCWSSGTNNFRYKCVILNPFVVHLYRTNIYVVVSDANNLLHNFFKILWRLFLTDAKEKNMIIMIHE